METFLSAAQRQVAIQVSDASGVGAARRLVADFSRRANLDETAAGSAALVVTEAASNIVKHAGKGEILVRPVYSGTTAGIEILAIDTGPGIANLAHSIEDGATTAGSYGIGLGAMRRTADAFDIYTARDQGTVIAMTIYGRSGTRGNCAVQLGAVCLPMPGETICGDAWALAAGPTQATLLVADGLGHGPLAAEASEMAAGIVVANPALPPGPAMQDIHLAVRATRGAAVAVAQLDLLANRVDFAGIGNIMASIYDKETRRQMVSHNGIVGSNMHRVQEFSQDWLPDSVLLLCSDGLGTRWDLNQYPGLVRHHPSVVAGILYRDFVRGRDDVSVLVIRERQD